MTIGWRTQTLIITLLVLFSLSMSIAVNAQVEDVKRLEEQVNALQEQQTKLQQQIEALQKQLTQLREQHATKAEADRKTPAPVTAGFGSIQFDGLVQQWFVGAFGNGATNTARMRRLELKFSGQVRPDVRWTVMVDPAKTLSVNTTSLGGTVVATGINQSSTILQDAYVSYSLNPQLTINLGQEKVPLSMTALRPSGQLLTVERPLMNVVPVTSGRLGDMRDVGVQAKWTTPKADVTLALLNDSGLRMNDVDNNNRLDFLCRGVYKGLPYTHLGVSGTLFTDSFGANKVPRRRLGLELAVNYGPHLFESEYGYAKDAPGGVTTRAEGGYASYAYRFSPRLQLVARGEIWNPNLDAAEARERDYTLGLNWYLQGHNAKIQLNWVRKDIAAAAPSYLGRSRTLLLTNFQTAW